MKNEKGIQICNADFYWIFIDFMAGEAYQRTAYFFSNRRTHRKIFFRIIGTNSINNDRLSFSKKAGFQKFFRPCITRKITNIQAVIIPLMFILGGIFSNWSTYLNAPTQANLIFAFVLSVGMVEELFSEERFSHYAFRHLRVFTILFLWVQSFQVLCSDWYIL
ncbi:MAG: hypothetical protein R2784_20240 [Saprospiraceae bacterium]